METLHPNRIRPETLRMVGLVAEGLGKTDLTVEHQPAPKALKEFLTADGLAKILGVSRSTLLAWQEKGLPAIKIGSKTFYHEPSVAAWFLSRQQSEDGTA